MANPLQRPNGEGTSRSYLVALAVMAVPMVQRYLESRGYHLDDGMVRDGVVLLIGLAVFFLRRGMRGSGVDVAEVLDKFEKYRSATNRLSKELSLAEQENERLRRLADAWVPEREFLRGPAEPATVSGDREDSPPGS